MRIVAFLAAIVFSIADARGQPAATPRTYALVSAIGGTFSLVRQRRSVGTSLEPYQRLERRVDGSELDAAVLRGLQRVVEEEDPHARFVILVVTPRYMNSGREGRGEKLGGIGVFVQPTEKMPASRDEFTLHEDAAKTLDIELDIEEDFPPEVLGPLVTRFVELSTADALREIFTTVTVSEPKAGGPAKP